MQDQSTITQKIEAVSKQNELEYLQEQFHKAGIAMLAKPTKENIEAYAKAENKLKAAEDSYREGYRILLSKQMENRNSSQKLHLL